MGKAVVDTNVLLDSPEILDELEGIILCSSVLEEIDGLKKSENSAVAHKAREANRRIERNKKKIKFILKDIYDDVPAGWDKDKRDNKIVLTALENNAKIISNDINVKLKAEALGVFSHGYYGDKKEPYTGWKIVDISEDDLADFYSNKLNNKWDININEYLLLQHKGEIVDKFKWTENGFKPVTKKSLKSIMFGDLKPKDIYQELAVDSLLSDQITVITGLAGSGKSILSLMYAMWAVQNGKYDSIVILFNPTKVRSAETMGWYGGTMIDKAMSNFIGNMLNTKFGDRSMVDTLLAQGKIKLVCMSDCRGMEIADNEILYITEAQNTNIDLMKICLSRVSKGAKVIIEGDPYSQVDSFAYLGKSNGLLRLIDIFKGEDLFSCVQLMKVQRSRIAEIADKM